MLIADLAVLASLLAPAPPQPDLKTLLRRAAEYAVDYHERFTALVADEHYVQRTGPDLRGSAPGRSLVEKERTLKSEYVIVRDFAGEGSWLGVRDAIEIDGEPVTADRERLHALLDDTSRPLAARVRALADLQAKFNLGGVYRTINVPTLPLEFLLPNHQSRFRFKSAGAATFGGAPVLRVSFEERERPTVIRSPNGRNVPSHGQFWLDPDTGAVLRTELFVSPAEGRNSVDATIIVSYKRNPRFDMLLPDDMDEMYFARGDRIEGHATYTNYRRFETEVRIK
jgi:hypothetical protein